MKNDLCKHHNLPKVRGHFCTECKKDLQKTSDRLNSFFSGLVIDFGKNGEPKFTRIKKTSSPENV